MGAWAALIWVSAPLLPAIRRLLGEKMPGRFDGYVVAGLLAMAVGILGLVWHRRRDDRWLAFGELALVFACFTGLYALLASSDPRSHVVELAHFAEYGTLAVLGFVSLGRLSPWARWAQTLLFVVAVGLVDEAIQWALASRVAEIRDLALNAAAGGLGLCYVAWVLRVADRKRTRITRNEMRQIVISGAFLLPAIVVFLYVVHLGYWIRWDDIEFVSQYRAAEIENVGESRRARWASSPGAEKSDSPRLPVVNLLTLEDFYVTEARRHIQARNEAASGGDLYIATGENLIVERWYSPYLEVAGEARTDLPVELGRPYRSLVPAHLWPELGSPAVWGVFIAAELALVGVAIYSGRSGRNA